MKAFRSLVALALSTCIFVFGNEVSGLHTAHADETQAFQSCQSYLTKNNVTQCQSGGSVCQGHCLSYTITGKNCYDDLSLPVRHCTTNGAQARQQEYTGDCLFRNGFFGEYCGCPDPIDFTYKSSINIPDSAGCGNGGGVSS